MANTFYEKAMDAFAKGEIDLLTDTINATLIDLADYTPNFATHDFMDDVPAGARVATVTLATKTVSSGGVFDAADGTFTAVSGDPSEAVLIWMSTGSDATSIPIALFDTMTGLPVTPNGGDIDIAWNASGIMKI